MLGWTKILDQVAKVKVKSITDPLFMYSVFFAFLGALTAIFETQNWVSIVLFLTAGLMLIIGLIFFIYFAIKNPDYLRSETFQLRKQSLEMLGDKDNSSNPNIKDAKYISSPYSRGIEGKSSNSLDA